MTAPASNRMNSGGSGSHVDCGPGCSVAEHKHGGPTGGGGSGSIVSDAKAELLQNADDQDDGQGRLWKIIEWYDQLKADLLRIMEGTTRDELGEVLQLLNQQMVAVLDARDLLTKSAEQTRDMAARL